MKDKKQKIVVLTGAGISAESGLGTFRDKGGLWDEYDINDVATPEAWEKNQNLVLEFYNKRRQLVRSAKPNIGHQVLVELENYFDVQIITQNIDDLHERAGSKKVLHLHGELLKAQCSKFEEDIFELNGKDIYPGDLSKAGYQIRPHVVWFGEAVPNMIEAENIIRDTNILIIVGTSLNVYPAANLAFLGKKETIRHVVDPNESIVLKNNHLRLWKGKATEKLPELVDHIIQDFKNR